VRLSLRKVEKLCDIPCDFDQLRNHLDTTGPSSALLFCVPFKPNFLDKKYDVSLIKNYFLWMCHLVVRNRRSTNNSLCKLKMGWLRLLCNILTNLYQAQWIVSRE
jgi:hypothetical protein